tara:strand:- start:1193 stop:1756 length:564 start_codon:yes stop_codon:yes gene_type:complete
MFEILENKILISHPSCNKDSLFYNTVIFLYQDRPNQGSLGFILNKPSKYTVEDICKDKKIEFNCSYRPPIYHGGPVNQQSLLMLHSDDWASQNTVRISDKLCITSDNFMLEKIGTNDQPAYWKIVGGLCGWAPGQLQAELTGKPPYQPNQSWLIADATDDVLFNSSGKTAWKHAFDICSSQLFDRYL